MAKLENTFKRYLVGIMGTRWDMQSHEDSLSEGIPDLSFGISGINGWIELKQVKAWPKLDKTLIKPQKYTPEQVNWLIRRGKKGGNCFVFVKVETVYFLFDWVHARNIKKGMSRQDYFDLSITHWYRNVNPDELARVLSCGRPMFNDVFPDGSKHSTDETPLGAP